MIYLLLSILSSTAIFVVFRSLKSYNIDTLQVIVINYITACIFGLFHYDEPVVLKTIIDSEWFIGALILGLLFIAVFNLMALTSQHNGLSVASVASKMSVVIPIVFGLYAYNESLGFKKSTGIVLALIAVFLTSMKNTKSRKLSKSLYLPILLFFGTGIIDTSLKYIETKHVPENGIPVFSSTIFCIAACIGILILTYRISAHKNRFELKSLPFGILLGIINYSSVFYLLKALQIKDLESSTLFTINNVAIITLTTLIGYMLFSEHISRKNWIGITFAIISILLVTLN